jgi:hypothetical protein
MPRSTPGPKPRSKVPPTATAEQQIVGFLAKFDPDVARQVRAARAALRRLLPTAIELVYDNYNFFVIGFCTTERASDCLVSLATSAKGVALSFYWGATLPDPHGLLLGTGKQNRFVRLDGPATLASAPVRALILAAAAQARTPLPARGLGHTVIKSISAKQRPRRGPRAVG